MASSVRRLACKEPPPLWELQKSYFTEELLYRGAAEQFTEEPLNRRDSSQRGPLTEEEEEQRIRFTEEKARHRRALHIGDSAQRSLFIGEPLYKGGGSLQRSLFTEETRLFTEEAI